MLLIALMRLLEAGSWRLIASALAMQEVLARNFDAATVKEREDLVRVNQNVESELTKLGLVFHRTDPVPCRGFQLGLLQEVEGYVRTAGLDAVGEVRRSAGVRLLVRQGERRIWQ
jgi:hypothetical protein